MSGPAIEDRPVWQHFSDSSWQSFADDASTLESIFRSGNDAGPLNVGTFTLDFSLMLDVVHNKPIRRLSSKGAPDVVYEWEETFTDGNGIWTPYSTDDCEAINISLRAGRRKIVLYVGHNNVPYEINFEASTQVNIYTQHWRWMRKTPPVVFSASPSAVAPAISALPLQATLSLEESAQNVIDGARQIIDFEEGDACPICLSSFDPSVLEERAWELRECSGHFFHAACIKIQLTRTGKCAVCSKAYIVQTGNQPTNGVMTMQVSSTGTGMEVAGYPAVGTIVLHYHFPSGTQGPDHPNPGLRYSGTSRMAFLPDTPEGREVAGLLKICFQRRLTFTVGRSLTTGLDNCIVWNGVHHKTSPTGGTQHYGWPDTTYFFRVKEELKAKGIVHR